MQVERSTGLLTLNLLAKIYVFLPGESQGWGSLVGCCLWGRTELATTEATYQQQQQFGTGEGNGTPLQYSCLENPMDGGAW